ncbi:hypothetical protein BZG35_03275 [Brevundimonas sp. LM2]|uniref:hypothetical protein n=1 Tax=Brevundimonas sp. LM2 TaxID=1938605 RepID=UPI000983F8C5|nr:hypothetical protein [Brevundimonas sp. LM2]AQR60780.1 hypothetical protein BZG35_03275 [Brevundimonas sp. LM2]
MNRFAILSAVAAIAASASVPAFAQSPAPTPAPERAQRVVMLCATDAATRASFQRDFGTRPVFVSADDALRARTARETWTAPRCMTEREHARLTQTLSAYAAR